MHIEDTLGTASACGLSLRPSQPEDPSPTQKHGQPAAPSFEAMIRDWFPLTYVLNNLNRGLGMPDGYPFVLSPPGIEKLRFVHRAITGV
jgi:hypothetical protein